jgi:hypothetical protein
MQKTNPRIIVMDVERGFDSKIQERLASFPIKDAISYAEQIERRVYAYADRPWSSGIDCIAIAASNAEKKGDEARALLLYGLFDSDEFKELAHEALDIILDHKGSTKAEREEAHYKQDFIIESMRCLNAKQTHPPLFGMR